MNGKGGTLDSEAVTVKYQFNYGSLPTPEKSDRVFEGWYTTSNFEDDTKVTDGSIVTATARFVTRSLSTNTEISSITTVCTGQMTTLP